MSNAQLHQIVRIILTVGNFNVHYKAKSNLFQTMTIHQNVPRHINIFHKTATVILFDAAFTDIRIINAI